MLAGKVKMEVITGIRYEGLRLSGNCPAACCISLPSACSSSARSSAVTHDQLQLLLTDHETRL